VNIDLTRRRHYTFEQVANLLQCSVEDLHYYVIEGELSPSLYLSVSQLHDYMMLPGEHYGTDGHVEPDELTSTDELNYGVAQTSYPRGFFHLVLGTQISTFERQFQFVATKPSGFDIGDLVFKLQSPIGLDEVFETCVVMATELDRFKASHSYPQTPTIQTETPTEEHAALGNRPTTTAPETGIASLDESEPCVASPIAIHQPSPEPEAPSEEEVDPSDLPEELDAANMAFRAVLKGYGKPTATPRNRIVAYLNEHYKTVFRPDAIQRIATVANPDKSPGRKNLSAQ
jgi:hypothetical protein